MSTSPLRPQNYTIDPPSHSDQFPIAVGDSEGDLDTMLNDRFWKLGVKLHSESPADSTETLSDLGQFPASVLKLAEHSLTVWEADHWLGQVVAKTLQNVGLFGNPDSHGRRWAFDSTWGMFQIFPGDDEDFHVEELLPVRVVGLAVYLSLPTIVQRRWNTQFASASRSPSNSRERTPDAEFARQFWLEYLSNTDRNLSASTRDPLVQAAMREHGFYTS